MEELVKKAISDPFIAHMSKTRSPTYRQMALVRAAIYAPFTDPGEIVRFVRAVGSALGITPTTTTLTVAVARAYRHAGQDVPYAEIIAQVRQLTGESDE